MKNLLLFKRISVCILLVVSINRVPFFNFFTFFGVPIIASISFSITKGESDAIGCSLFMDSMIRNLAKLSGFLNKVKESYFILGIRSLSFDVCGIHSFCVKSQQICASPSMEP